MPASRRQRPRSGLSAGLHGHQRADNRDRKRPSPPQPSWSYGLAAAGYLLSQCASACPGARRARGLAARRDRSPPPCGRRLCIAAEWPCGPVRSGAGAADTLRYAAWFVFLGPAAPGSAAARASSAVACRRPCLSRASCSPQARPWRRCSALGGAARRIRDSARHCGPRPDPGRAADPPRATRSRAGASSRCASALGGVFGFDLFFYADALLFGRLDADIWVARGVANALVIPLIAIATARNTGWTIDMHVSRAARLPIRGAAALRPLPAWQSRAPGYYVRFFGGDWGRALQIEIVFAAVVLAVWCASSGRFRSRLKVFVSKHFFSYRYDYREEWLRFTRTLSAEGSVQTVQERASRRSPTWSRARRASSGSMRGTALSSGRALEYAGDRRGGAGGQSVHAIPGAHREADRRGGVRRNAAGVPGIDAACLAHRDARRPGSSFLWRPAPTCSAFVVLDDTSCRHRHRLGGARPPEDGEPPGGQLSRADQGDRSAARGPQVRRVQPHVRVRRPRSQEPRRPAFADAQECRTTSRQSGVPARHAGDGGARRRSDEQPDAAAPHGRDAGGKAAPGRPRADRAQGLRRRCRPPGHRAGCCRGRCGVRPRGPARTRHRPSGAKCARRDGARAAR